MGDAGYGSGLGSGMGSGTGGSTLGGRTGGAEVHGDLGVGRESGNYSAIAVTGSVADQSSGTGSGGEGLRDQAMGRVRDVAGSVRERAQGLMDGMPAPGDVAGQAREKVGDALGRAQTLLEDRGVLNMVRDNPLPALGVAFGVGFLLAGKGDRNAGGKMGQARNQLRGAIMGGLSAAVAQEARNLIGAQGGAGGLGGILGSVLGNLQGQGGGSRSGSGSTHRPPSHRESF